MRKRDIDWIIRRCGNGYVVHSSRFRVGPWGNARTDITEEIVDARALSLIKEGQKEPVKGLFSSDNECFELIDGELRLRGWNLAKTKYGVDLDEVHGGIYCELQSGFERVAPTKKDILLLQVSYGTGSIPLCDYDRANVVSKLIESGESVKELAIIMHCTEQTIRNLLAIHSVPNRVKKVVKPTTALKYSRATLPVKKEVEDKIDGGKKVKAKDIPTKSESTEKVVNESIPFTYHEKRCLEPDEIRQQIKIADGIMRRTKKDKFVWGWQQYIRALKSVIGEEITL